MKRISARLGVVLTEMVLTALAVVVSSLLFSHPAQAHGTAATGLFGGLVHPLLGVDHLLLLGAVGAAAALISGQVLLWALGGAVIGAALGSNGFTLPFIDGLAALSIMAVALVIFGASTRAAAFSRLWGPVVAAAMAVHAMLHGLEAPQDSTNLLWWAGALGSSLLVVAASALLIGRLPAAAPRWHP